MLPSSSTELIMAQVQFFNSVIALQEKILQVEKSPTCPGRTSEGHWLFQSPIAYRQGVCKEFSIILNKPISYNKKKKEK